MHKYSIKNVKKRNVNFNAGYSHCVYLDFRLRYLCGFGSFLYYFQINIQFLRQTLHIREHILVRLTRHNVNKKQVVKRTKHRAYARCAAKRRKGAVRRVNSFRPPSA